MKEIEELIGKKSPTLEDIDDWICRTAEHAASEGDGKRWNKESRTAICRWVLRTLVYGEMKVEVLRSLNKCAI